MKHENIETKEVKITPNHDIQPIATYVTCEFCHTCKYIHRCKSNTYARFMLCVLYPIGSFPTLISSSLLPKCFVGQREADERAT